MDFHKNMITFKFFNNQPMNENLYENNVDIPDINNFILNFH